MVSSIFNVSAFFIVLREVLEAALVVGIVLAHLKRTGGTQYRRYVWAGACTAIALSLVFAVSFIIVYYVKGSQLFAGNTERIFEGVMFLVASILLTWMTLWIFAVGSALRTKMHATIDAALAGGSARRAKAAIFLMVFFQILREGIETVIFLAGAANTGSASRDRSAWRGIILPGILAIIIALAAAYALFRGLIEMDIHKFFQTTGVLLIAFAAGLFSHALHELQEANLFGSFDEIVAKRPWWNRPVADLSECCSDKRSEFFALLRSLFGYQDKPTSLEIGAYYLYWLVLVVILLVLHRSRVRTHRRRIASSARFFCLILPPLALVGLIHAGVSRAWQGALLCAFAMIAMVASGLVVFDIASLKTPSLRTIRRSLGLGTGIILCVIAALAIAFHIAQLACEGDFVKGRPMWRCGVARYYYAGLIFADDWLRTAPVGKSWIGGAVLCFSLGVWTFLYSAAGLSVILFSTNVDTEGAYLSAEGDVVKDITEEVDDPSLSPLHASAPRNASAELYPVRPATPMTEKSLPESNKDADRYV